jgi:hypothetical protein
MKICDFSERIVEWSSEPFGMNYYSRVDQKNRKYFVDFWIKVIDDSKNITKILVEIKPTEPTEEYIDFVNNMIDFDKTDFILCVGEPNSKQPLGYHFSKNGFYKGFDFPSINANNYQQAREQAISYRFDLK